MGTDRAGRHRLSNKAGGGGAVLHFDSKPLTHGGTTIDLSSFSN